MICTQIKNDLHSNQRWFALFCSEWRSSGNRKHSEWRLDEDAITARKSPLTALSHGVSRAKINQRSVECFFHKFAKNSLNVILNSWYVMHMALITKVWAPSSQCCLLCPVRNSQQESGVKWLFPILRLAFKGSSHRFTTYKFYAFLMLFETGEISDIPFNLIEWNRYHLMWFWRCKVVFLQYFTTSKL